MRFPRTIGASSAAAPGSSGSKLPTRTFSFCKTACLSYDHVVVACLLTAQRVLGDKIEISSDGGVNDFLDQTESWNESARSLYTRTFGEPPLEPPGIVGNVNLLQ
jgi:hypothetical protein